ncbi:Glycosyl hydrolases family 15 [Thalassoglobus neptunius]|uniref:Glycosyl hydrolases family 15 n=2 Tax=Thalassoglobus neptunius TaxID=1938619 RepID=A0A5C5X9S1_9PLAN|nr:Glycosyl hydrolases family 15 [Thalassoglobus neptunius]
MHGSNIQATLAGSFEGASEMFNQAVCARHRPECFGDRPILAESPISAMEEREMDAIGTETPPAQWLSEKSSAADIDRVEQFLNDQGTFRFPTLSSGLFSAAAGDHAEFGLTGYQNVWVRDNIHVAHALWVAGQKDVAVQAVEAFVSFYTKYQHKFVDIIEGRADPSDAQARPHIRFDGTALEENEEEWAHAQNDAIGYLLWLICKFLRSGDLKPSPELPQLLALIVKYLNAIEYWKDEDSGHWEETKKIEASSLGPVIAGFEQLLYWLDETESELPGLTKSEIKNIQEQGIVALAEILPAECIQPDPSQNRRYDAALLFLAYPLDVLDEEMTRQIAEDVRSHLSGPIGIRRYIGDSYWCADYRTLLAADKRTTDYSEDTSSRDALLKEGQEAQWCIFDPILSVIYGRLYLESGDVKDREHQLYHLQRSLGQLTPAVSRFGAYRCPESYFLEAGEWIPNDICPLLWTQGNLLLALHWMKQSLQSA